MSRLKRKPDCHPDRIHRGLGLCRRCYAREYARRPESKKRRKTYYEKNREKIFEQFRLYRDKNRPRLADYDKYRRNRLGAGYCAICKDYTESLHRDHNHSTEQIRDGLCFHCNAALGLFKEQQERLKAAIDYLDKWDRAYRETS